MLTISENNNNTKQDSKTQLNQPSTNSKSPTVPASQKTTPAITMSQQIPTPLSQPSIPRGGRKRIHLFISTAIVVSLFQAESIFADAKAHHGSLRVLDGRTAFPGADKRKSNLHLRKEDWHYYEPSTTISTTVDNVYDSYKQHAPVGIESTTTTTTISAETNYIPTDVANLAKDFDQALIAVNKNQEDLHVGKLLSACGRLETAMRQIGFAQSANDIAGNVKKVRSVYDRLPKDKRDSISNIVEYEFESGVHGSNKHTLKEKSAAMGFLWLGRSINYQYDMFQHMLDNDDDSTSSSPYEAARYAYEKDLKPHLSWPLQKVCQAAMTRLKAVPKNQMFSKIGGFEEDSYGCQEHQATKRDLKKLVDSSWKPMLNRWKQIFNDLEMDQI